MLFLILFGNYVIISQEHPRILLYDDMKEQVHQMLLKKTLFVLFAVFKYFQVAVNFALH